MASDRREIITLIEGKEKQSTKQYFKHINRGGISMYYFIRQSMQIAQRTAFVLLVSTICSAFYIDAASAAKCKKKASRVSLDLTVGAGSGFGSDEINNSEKIVLAANSMNAIFKILRKKGSLNTAQLLEFRRASSVLNNLSNALTQSAYKEELKTYWDIKKNEKKNTALDTLTYKKMDRLMFGRLK